MAQPSDYGLPATALNCGFAGRAGGTRTRDPGIMRATTTPTPTNFRRQHYRIRPLRPPTPPQLDAVSWHKPWHTEPHWSGHRQSDLGAGQGWSRSSRGSRCNNRRRHRGSRSAQATSTNAARRTENTLRCHWLDAVADCGAEYVRVDPRTVPSSASTWLSLYTYLVDGVGDVPSDLHLQNLSARSSSSMRSASVTTAAARGRRRRSTSPSPPQVGARTTPATAARRSPLRHTPRFRTVAMDDPSPTGGRAIAC